MRFKHLVTLVACSALLLAAPAYAAAAGPDTVPASVDSSSPQAEAALAEVQDLFRGGQKARARAHGPQPVAASERPHATMALRDLYFLREDLAPADRAQADRYFARPSDPGGDGPFAQQYQHAEATPKCGSYICVHYIDSTNPLNAGDVDATTPQHATDVLVEAEHVWDVEVTKTGYEPPMSDGAKGGNALFDIYLANEKDNGLYGYCASDDPNVDGDFKVWAYCVIDNDFANYNDGFTPTENLQVTLAHEFFHAVQFAYDAGEDGWFMEGTAAWMEDEVYDTANANMIYLSPLWKADPIRAPWVPLDKFNINTWPAYGTWTFWKKLSETYRTKNPGGTPNIVREIWTAAANPDPKGASTMALSKVLARHRTSFGAFFTKWGVGNRFPARSYSEGRANHYPKAPLAGRFSLSKSKRSLAWKGIQLDHMTNAHARITPKLLQGRGWKLRVTVDAPERIRGSHATVVVHKRNGSISKAKVRLNRSGAGVKTVPFGIGTVKYVEVTLTNASNRFKGCYPSIGYSSITCGGRSLDNNLPFRFKASVLR